MFYLLCVNRIGDIMMTVLDSSAVVRGFEPRSGKTKDYEIGIYCFSATHAGLRRKRSQNQDNESDWSNMSTRGMLFQ